MKFSGRQLLDKRYGFAVDTDSYAGGFERELVAHMTGCYGDCDVGKDEALRARREMKRDPSLKKARRWFLKYVVNEPDDKGCARPASIFPTPGWFNDGMGNEHPTLKLGSQEVHDQYVESVRKYYGERIESAKKWFERSVNEEMAASARDAIRRHDEQLTSAIEKGPGNHSSFQSAVVWLDKKPPQWIIDVLKERAMAYLAKGSKWIGNAKIIGFRVVKVSESARWNEV